MKKAGWCITIAILAASVGARADSRIEKHLALAPGGELVVRADAGSVTVNGGGTSGADIVITSSRDDIQRDFTFSFDSGPGLARVTAKRTGGNSSFWSWLWGRGWHGNLHFNITVPTETRLNIKTGGGSVEVSSLHGDEELGTSGGPIKASGIRGNVHANTSGGSIELRHVDGDATVTTSGGPISVDSLGGSLRAHTSGGGIRVNGVTGRVDASTSGGTIHAVFARGNNRGGNLETSGGSIEVSLDPAVNLDIDASTFGGTVTSELPLRVEGTISKSKLQGTLGSGGETLRLHTSGGSIRIASGAIEVQQTSRGETLRLHTSGGSARIASGATGDQQTAGQLRLPPEKDQQTARQLRLPGEEKQMISSHAVGIVGIVSFFGFIPAIIWVIFSYVRRVKVARMQAEVHSKLIDKIGSSPDALAYLNTESGKQLVASMGIDQPRREPYGRILASVRAGVILLALGIAFLVLGHHFADTAQGFYVLGWLGVALGAGFLISGGISYGLSKKFGLLDGEHVAEKPVS